MAFGGSDILKLIVDADTKGAVSEFNKLEKTAGSSLDGVEKKATGLSGKMSSAFGSLSGVMSSLGPAAIAGGVAAGIGVAVNAASNLNEQISKTKAVFGDSSAAILTWSDTASTSLGQSKTQALEAASSFGNLFQQLGLTGTAVVEMSTQMTGLATDFASFFNTDPASALEAISAAFRGEFDSVQKFVPTINAAAVQQEVLKEGLAKSTKEITEQDKAVATYNLLLNGAGKATGDFARTSDGLANQQRILKAEVSDLTAELGNRLIPTLTKLANFGTITLKFATEGLDKFEQIDKQTGGLLGDLFKSVELTLNPVKAGIDNVSDSYNFFLDLTKTGNKDVADSGAAASAAAGGFTVFAAAVGRVTDAVVQAAAGTPVIVTALTTASSTVGALNAKLADSQASSAFIQGSSGIGRAMENQATLIRAANDALSTHINLVLEAAGGMLGVGAAQREFNKAVEDNIKVQTDAKATTDEKTAATDRETQAALSVASATVDYAKKQEEASGKTLTAKDSQKLLIDTLYTLASKSSPEVQAALGDVITKLQDVGAEHPEPTVSVDDQASTPLDDVKGKVDGLDGARATIAVGADVSSAKSAVNGLINGLNSISGITGIRYKTIAKGTRDFVGGLALVGERRPEMVILPPHSAVKTAGETKKIMDGPTPLALSAGSGSSSNVVQITVNGAVDPYSTARQIQTILAKGGYAGFSAKAA